jgi:hypothetical protein
MGRVDYTKFTPADMSRLALYSFAWQLDHPEEQLLGVTYVESMEGFSVLGAMKTSGSLKEAEGAKMMALGMDTLPLRIRHIYLVKQPRWFSWFWGAVKFLLRKKLRDRLHVLGEDFAALHAAVPAANLPPEFGGTLATPQSAILDEMEAIEKATGMLGGFAIPMREWWGMGDGGVGGMGDGCGGMGWGQGRSTGSRAPLCPAPFRLRRH